MRKMPSRRRLPIRAIAADNHPSGGSRTSATVPRLFSMDFVPKVSASPRKDAYRQAVGSNSWRMITTALHVRPPGEFHEGPLRRPFSDRGCIWMRQRSSPIRRAGGIAIGRGTTAPSLAARERQSVDLIKIRQRAAVEHERDLAVAALDFVNGAICGHAALFDQLIAAIAFQ